MASIDEDLSQIEKEIRTLKIEYEQFFGGGRARPPADTQWRVDLLIKRYAERAGDLNFSQRFRYNNLAQTYAKYQDMWRKKMMQKEGSVTPHHFGAAAKAIEAERARQAPPAQTATSPASEPHPAHAHRTASAKTEESHDSRCYSLSVSDPEHEKEKVRQLYHKLVEARTASGEKSSTPSLNDFEKFVRQKTKDLQKKGGHEVEYTVSVEGGRVKLKARLTV